MAERVCVNDNSFNLCRSFYLGDGQAVHAPSKGKNVIVAPIANKWWARRYEDAVRIIR